MFAGFDTTADDLPDLFLLELSHANGAWHGSTPVNLTNTPDDGENNSTWSPDDTRILFGNGRWKASRRGTAKSSPQVLIVATEGREILLENQGLVHPTWKRSDP